MWSSHPYNYKEVLNTSKIALFTVNSPLFWTSWYLFLQQSTEDVNSNNPFSKNNETHCVNILLSLLGCATQKMTGDILMDILIPVAFLLKKAKPICFGT